LKIMRWFFLNFVSRHNRNAGDFSDAAGEREMALKCRRGVSRKMRETWQVW